MRAPRRPFRRSGTPEADERDADPVNAAKLEARALAKRQREESRAARREQSRPGRQPRTAGGDEWVARARETASEIGVRLAPAGRGLLSFFGWIAPPISNALMAAFGAFALGILWVSETGRRAVAWLGAHAVPVAERLLRAAAARITPVSTFAVVGGAAAIALGVSQFLDYRGVAVGAPQYKGEVGVTAPVPLTDVKIAGSAHLYALVPVAAAALVLIVLTALGRWRLGRWVAALGLVGIVVSLIIDAPKGLDAGNAGIAFAGADAELLKGFWIQLLSSTVLVMCGLLLAREVRAKAGADGRQPSPGWRRAPAEGVGEPGKGSSRPAPPHFGAST